MRTMTLPSARRNWHALLANTFHHISPTVDPILFFLSESPPRYACLVRVPVPVEAPDAPISNPTPAVSRRWEVCCAPTSTAEGRIRRASAWKRAAMGRSITRAR